jgi:DnaJ-class molecular chaperone
MDLYQPDLYETLGVRREACDAEIKRAYRERARQRHPDRAGPSPAAAFQQLTHAYEVLSDPQQRAEYELRWLKSSASSPEALLDGVLVEQVFAATFGYSLSAASSGPSSFDSSDSLRSSWGALEVSPGTSPPSWTAPVLNVDVPLPCQLEELFLGCTKRLRIDRRIYRSGGFDTEPEELVCQVGPGWKTSTRIQFKGGRPCSRSPHDAARQLVAGLAEGLRNRAGPARSPGSNRKYPAFRYSQAAWALPARRQLASSPARQLASRQRARPHLLRPAGKGDQHPGQPAQDITFVVAEQPHASFMRRGNDLHTCAMVPLGTAL